MISLPAVKRTPEHKHWTLYDIASGRILGTGYSIAEMVPRASGQKLLMAQSNPALQYVKDGILRLRQTLEVTVERRTIRGLPEGTTLYAKSGGMMPVVTGGDWTAPDEIADAMVVTVDHPHYRPFDVLLRDYRVDRIENYPGLGDQLDAVAKGFKALRRAGVPLPNETNAWLNAIDAVKAAHPKD